MSNFPIPPFHNYQPNFYDPSGFHTETLVQQLDVYLRELRMLLASYPNDKKKVNVAVTRLKQFITSHENRILNDCSTNGWNTSIPYNYSLELYSAMRDFSQYDDAVKENNLLLAKNSLKHLDDSLTQIGFFLSNKNSYESSY